MRSDIGRLLSRFTIIDEEMLALRGRLIEALGQGDELQRYINNQTNERTKTTCNLCENNGICTALLGAAFFASGDYKKAIRQCETAGVCFRGIGEYWNQVNTLELLGWAYESDGYRHQAEKIYREASHILHYKIMHLHAQYEGMNLNELEAELQSLIKEALSGVQPPKAGKTRMKAVLSIARIPVYARVQAGPDGPIWVDPLPEKNFTDIENILLEDKPHQVFSLLRGIQSITLGNDKQYGWAKVAGDSMNACTPVPIQHDDFILFYTSDTADDNSIVIASLPDTAGSGLKFVVKRYDQHAASLHSEAQQAKEYPQIPITEGVRILGTVIAVAKPV